MSFLDLLLGVIAYGAEVRVALAQPGCCGADVTRARRHKSWRRAQLCKQSLSSLVGRAQDS
jgi:hypothetical protein